MEGDRPITNAADDRLGFAVVAEHLAKAILDQSSRDGFVIGVDGKWGSGKSTLINLTIEELKKGARAPAVVAFSPWLVGDRDTLLRQLFDELASASLNIEPIGTSIPPAGLQRLWARLSSKHWRLRQMERAKKKLARQLHAFGLAAGGAGKIAKAASYLGMPWGTQAASLAYGSKEALSSLLAGGALSNQKAKIVTLLAALSRPIVVFVDDLDRLEPSEACEVLRLIRAVADFPNVIYIVSYDADVVASTLGSTYRVKNGHEYLEKIVQVSFRVPLPEAFDLRNWFRIEVDKIFGDPSWRDSGRDQRESPRARLDAAVNTQGGAYLRTPRDVVRTLNALHLHSAPVRGLVDIPDMVWLQLIKIGNRDLYDWIERYLSEAAAMFNGAFVSDEEAQMMGERLAEILTAEGGDVGRKLIELSHVLPGIDTGSHFAAQKKNRTVFKTNLFVDHLINPLIAERRLGSPHHYRFYFSFSVPAGSLPDEVVREFLAKAGSDTSSALAMFSKLAGKNRPQGGSMADVLIDRLSAIPDRISGDALLAILHCFTETMDDVARSSPASDFGTDRTWSLAEKLTRICLRNAPSEVRTRALGILFVEGKSLGWLTDLIRGEIFDHGIFGDRKKPEDEWLLSAEEFNSALGAMLKRYRSADPNELMRTPNFLSLLYGWEQGSGTTEVQEWVDEQTANDAGLLAILPRMRSMAFRNAVVYPLSKDDMVRFFDYQQLWARVKSIADNPAAPEADRLRAREILEALRLGEKSHRG